MKMLRMKVISVVCYSVFVSCLFAGEEFKIVEAGNVFADVVIKDNASPAIKLLAAELTNYLHRITGCNFKIIEGGDSQKGIVIGTFKDYPDIKAPEAKRADAVGLREMYILRTYKGGLFIIGQTDMAIEHGVWDFLYRIGYRQFFPTAKWEYIPHYDKLVVNLDVCELPAYHTRIIFYGYGSWANNMKLYEKWVRKNRMRGAFALSTSHAYEGIISANKEEFDKHPEYLGLVDGKRKSSKFCIANKDLRELVKRYAVQFFKDRPDADSISMEPSDGGGWCECEDCKALGNITDRALLLANEVAEELGKHYTNKYVAMYAYSFHSPPPQNLTVHSNVIISFATAFIRGGYTFDGMVAGWKAKGANMVGIRDYYEVSPWDRDLPGRPKASSPSIIARDAQEFYKKVGARFFITEAGDDWGICGLGYYVASRVLWDVNEAERLGEIKEDFFDKMFGSTKNTMKEFYTVLDKERRSPLDAALTDNLVNRMYSLLKKAKEEAGTNQIVQARIDDLVLYTRYVELYKKYSRSREGKARQEAFTDLMRFIYAIKDNLMVHSFGLYRDMPERDKGVAIPLDLKLHIQSSGKNKSVANDLSDLIEEDDDIGSFKKLDINIEKFISDGIKNNKRIDLEIKNYSTNLVKLDIRNKEYFHLYEANSNNAFSIRGKNIFYLYADQTNQEIKLVVSGGFIYENSGNISISLYNMNSTNAIGVGKIPTYKKEHQINFKLQNIGLYRLEVDDRSAGATVIFEPELPVVVPTFAVQKSYFLHGWRRFFYVPAGTKKIIGLSTGPGNVFSPFGGKVFSFPGYAEFFEIPVNQQDAGQVWEVKDASGVCVLLNVPSYFANNPKNLLVPEEVLKEVSIEPK